ncbi:hypothetical protein BDR06DRAFT_975414 [Suillus hirtellus]|nr:hypothetical protein BDR06DRAFT_975414 [Suillus hirtellus]
MALALPLTVQYSAVPHSFILHSMAVSTEEKFAPKARKADPVEEKKRGQQEKQGQQSVFEAAIVSHEKQARPKTTSAESAPTDIKKKATECTSLNHGMLIIGHVISGLSVGISSTIVPVYQLLHSQSVVAWFPSNNGLSLGGILLHLIHIPWGLQMIPAIVLSLCMLAFPKFPCWLVDNNQYTFLLHISNSYLILLNIILYIRWLGHHYENEHPSPPGTPTQPLNSTTLIMLPELIGQNVLDPSKLAYLNKHHLMRSWQTEQGIALQARQVHDVKN